MPTATGGDTIGERLQKRRAALARVEATIARAENIGQDRNLGGAAVTEIAYERAKESKRELEAEILTLERRLAGSPASPHSARAQTRMP